MAASAMRTSQRVSAPRSIGIRIIGERLCSDQVTLTGASCAGTRRLYELTSGFVIAQ